MSQVSVKHRYQVPVASVFDSFLNAESAGQFMFRTDAGRLVTSKLEPEPGGAFVFSEERAEGLVEHAGTFVEIEKNEKITFVFSVSLMPERSDFVEILFAKTGTGCEVSLNFEVPPEMAGLTDKFKQGWGSILAKLEKYLEYGQAAEARQTPQSLVTKDSQGQALAEGDSVKTIKDLKVKGSSMVVKRGTVVKKVHLIPGNDEEVDVRVDGVALSLETRWLVKV